ncbi:MAG: hypothetical protein Q8P81_04310, partial [Nanoarchaeota archaeon]|nr:hypothetical protein [Nanoarchaeota archaeon]
EVANWLNFSLIIFAMGFRFFYSLFEGSFEFFYQGLIGLGFFFVLGNLLYYGRFFAGGDAKLMIALGAVLPLTKYFHFNLRIFLIFFAIFLLIGGIYSLGVSLFFGIKNFERLRREFKIQLRKNKGMVLGLLVLGLLFLILGIYSSSFLVLGMFLAIFPYVYIYAKAVDEACMVVRVRGSNLSEGDWLYEKIRIGNKTVYPKWEGLSLEEINLIKKKHKSVLVRKGIPFTPVFLISFLILIWLWFSKILGTLLLVF